MENKNTYVPKTDDEIDKALHAYLTSPLAMHRAKMTRQEKQNELETYRRLYPGRVTRADE